MKPISGYLIRQATPEEIELAARMAHEAVRMHCLQFRERWPQGHMMSGHQDKGGALDVPTWEQAPEAMKERAREPIRKIIENGGRWGTSVDLARQLCGCAVIGLMTSRMVLVELGVLPARLPEDESMTLGDFLTNVRIAVARPERDPASDS